VYGANAHPGFASQVNIVLKEDADNTLPAENMTSMNVTLYRSLTDATWNSICLPFDLDADGIKSVFGTNAKVAAFTSATSTNLHFDLVTTMSAKTPYLIYPDGGRGANDPITMSGVTVQPTPQTVSHSPFNFTGIYSLTAIDGKYFIATGNTIKRSTGGNLKAFRAYIEDTTSSARELSLDFGENITGIDATLLNQDVMNHEFYNLAGQRVAKPGKGLYVVNGKKVVIK